MAHRGRPYLGAGALGRRDSHNGDTNLVSRLPSASRWNASNKASQHSPAARPSQSVGPPSAMGTKKRPTGPTTRGQSPPEKRSRLPEGPSETAKRRAPYASPRSPVRSCNAPSSRKNSVGVPINAPSGPAPKYKDGRRIDPDRPYDRRASMDWRQAQGSPRNGIESTSLRKGSVDEGSTILSPLSMHGETGLSGSGGSTPIQIAPPAPSMTPVMPRASSIPGADASVDTSSINVTTNSVAPANSAITVQKTGERLDQNGPPTRFSVSTLRRSRDQKRNETKVQAERALTSLRPIDGTSQNSNVDANANITATNSPAVSLSSMLARIVALEMKVERLQKEKSSAIEDSISLASLLQFKDVTESANLVEKYTQLDQRERATSAKADEAETKARAAEARLLKVEADIQNAETKTENALAKAESAETQAKGTSIEVSEVKATAQTAETTARNAEITAMDTGVRLHEDLTKFRNDIGQSVGSIDDELTKLRADAGQVLTLDKRLTATTNNIEKMDQDLRQTINSLQQNGQIHIKKEQLKKFETLLSNMEQGSTLKDIKEMNDRLMKLEAQPSDVESAAVSGHSSERMNKLEARVLTIEGEQASLNALNNGISQNVTSLNDDLSTNERKVHTCTVSIAALQSEMPNLLRQTLSEDRTSSIDPLRADVEALKQCMAHPTFKVPMVVANEINNLRLHLEKQIQDVGIQSSTNAQTLQTMQQDANSMRQDSKRKFEKGSNEIEILSFAIQDLESRYNNINTNEIHQRMVNWFMETFPDAPALHSKVVEVQGTQTRLSIRLQAAETSLMGVTNAINKTSNAEAIANQALETVNILRNDVSTLRSTPDKGPELERLKKMLQEEVNVERNERIHAVAKQAEDHQQLGRRVDECLQKTLKTDNEVTQTTTDFEEFKKQLGKVDQLLSLKPRIKTVVGLWPQMKADQGKMWHFLKSVNSNLAHPLKDLALDLDHMAESEHLEP